jgi:hypothetical protein
MKKIGQNPKEIDGLGICPSGTLREVHLDGEKRIRSDGGPVARKEVTGTSDHASRVQFREPSAFQDMVPVHHMRPREASRAYHAISLPSSAAWTRLAAARVCAPRLKEADMDPVRRKILEAGAAAAAMATASRVLAQTGSSESAMTFYERGPVRIHYEQTGSGFPLMLIAGGGLNSTIDGLKNGSPFNAMLAPKAEVSMFPWKEPKERIPLAVRQIRSFLRAHRPAST